MKTDQWYTYLIEIHSIISTDGLEVFEHDDSGMFWQTVHIIETTSISNVFLIYTDIF